MCIVAIGILNAVMKHDAVAEGVPLNPVLVSSAVAPELRSLISWYRFEAMPEVRQLFTRLITYRPSIFVSRRSSSLVA